MDDRIGSGHRTRHGNSVARAAAEPDPIPSDEEDRLILERKARQYARWADPCAQGGSAGRRELGRADDPVFMEFSAGRTAKWRAHSTWRLAWHGSGPLLAMDVNGGIAASGAYWIQATLDGVARTKPLMLWDWALPASP